MLTSELVRTRQRDSKLEITRLSPQLRDRAEELARTYIAQVENMKGASNQTVVGALRAVAVQPRETKLARGLHKLLLDRCEFSGPPECRCDELRAQVFLASARHWQIADPPFDRSTVLAEIALKTGHSPDTIEQLLFADIKENQRLERWQAVGPEALVDEYVRSSLQAVLLRATRVVIEVPSVTPTALRRFLAHLKFQQLLFTLTQREPSGYRIHIDGPLSLFEATTAYGMKLAGIVGAIERLPSWALEADVVWGKTRRRATLTLTSETFADLFGRARPAAATEAPADERLREIVEGVASLGSPWQAAPATELLHLPGVGVVVPDLVFHHSESRTQIHLEIMGHWSRDAVWKRVDIVEAGLAQPVLFAVSERLRVSEAVLDHHERAALLVYKGVLAPRRILERLDDLRTKLVRS